LSRPKAKADAFIELLQPLQKPLEVFCRRMLRKGSLAEDVVQSALAAAFSEFERGVTVRDFKAWIFRFVTLEIFNRNRKREPILFGEFLDNVPAQPFEGLSEDIVGILLENPGLVMEHMDEQIVQALWQLRPLERAVLLLRAVGEFSYQEMHEILSIPLGSVMGYLSRARLKMRRSLAEYAAHRGLIRRQESQP
jgi:RNA polymerase sigma-70 factor (ECF subfamily)